MSGGRRFTREETAIILRRATDGEQRVESRRDGSLTLDEIVAAARDAGIDAAAVRRAAAVSILPSSSLAARIFGAAADVTLQADFAGSLDGDLAPRARAVIERSIGRRGEPESSAEAFVWGEEHGLGRTRIEARGRTDGLVEVTATAERKGHLLALISSVAIGVGALMVPLGGFAGLASAIGPLGSALAPLAVIGVATRALWPPMQRRALRRVEAALLELGSLAEERGELRG